MPGSPGYVCPSALLVSIQKADPHQEWKYGLRSSLHPAIFALGYAAIDSSLGELYSVKAQWLVAAPRVMQAGFAALGDWYSWRLAEKFYGHSTPMSWAVVSVSALTFAQYPQQAC